MGPADLRMDVLNMEFKLGDEIECGSSSFPTLLKHDPWPVGIIASVEAYARYSVRFILPVYDGRTMENLWSVHKHHIRPVNKNKNERILRRSGCEKAQTQMA